MDLIEEMGYKIIAVDLDDTLLNDKLMISQINLEAISYAQQKGVKVVLCTGRATDSVKSILTQVKTYSEKDFFISYNGAFVSSIQGDVIFKKVITQPYITQLVDLGKNQEVDIQFYSDNDLYVDFYSETTMNYEKHTGSRAVVIKDLKELEFTLKILYNSLNTNKLENLRRIITSSYKDELNVFYSKKNYLEVLMKEGNKGLALEYLVNYLGIKKEEVIAIGDSENDLSMINYAGLGVCMKNGNVELKQMAQYVTQKNNNESGVAEVIYKFII